MVISVTPMVCITLAFWLGRIGLIASGGCCASASGAAQMTANRIAKVKRESRFREIIVALLVVEFGALCIAPVVNGKKRLGVLRQNLQLFTKSRDRGLKLRQPTSESGLNLTAQTMTESVPGAIATGSQ